MMPSLHIISLAAESRPLAALRIAGAYVACRGEQVCLIDASARQHLADTEFDILEHLATHRRTATAHRVAGAKVRPATGLIRDLQSLRVDGPRREYFADGQFDVIKHLRRVLSVRDGLHMSTSQREKAIARPFAHFFHPFAFAHAKPEMISR